ncbi:alpha-L-fucosidase [Flavobacterium sp. ZB4P13]|uniref:alpha-L-fucosidase n=1 Tax=Flavobacterium sp. ZB4P13 TaxID=3401728 RepID=UPI003AAAB792
MRPIIIAFLLGVFLNTHAQESIRPPSAVLPVPSAEQLAWHEMEMNAFIHFTTNTFTGKEWGLGDEKPAVFNPSAANPEQWITVLKDSGFKGVILTTKHHDGFCLWPSKYTEHSVKNSPYKNGKGDIVKEVSDACKKNDLKFGIYLSPWDRNHAQYGKPAYIEYYRNQLKELIANYGPVFEIWFDGANGGSGFYGGANENRKINGATYYDWPGTISLVRNMLPNVIFFSDAGPSIRWVGNERGSAGKTNWNTISIDTLYAGKPGIDDLLNKGSEDGTSWVPAETDVSIRPGWFYHKEEDALVKTPEQLFEIYLSSVGRGSTLLLNMPPDRRGLIHENDVKSLKGFRKLLDSEFKNNLAVKAAIKASSYRGNSKIYAAEKMLDNNTETYWATNGAVTTATIDIDLKGVKAIKYIVLQEYIKLGQRVKSFTVEALIDNKWQTVEQATTIGYKRILKLNNLKTNKIRISILDSKSCPLISSLKIY